MPPTATHQQDNSYGRSAIWRVSKFVIPLIAGMTMDGKRPRGRRRLRRKHVHCQMGNDILEDRAEWAAY